MMEDTESKAFCMRGGDSFDSEWGGFHECFVFLFFFFFFPPAYLLSWMVVFSSLLYIYTLDLYTVRI